MKKRRIVLLCLMLMVFVLSLTFVYAGTSAEKGKALFQDPKLGGSTTDKSCDSCHHDGKGLGNVSQKEWGPGELEATVNQCVTQALKGKELPKDSEEMQSLILYIRSF